MLNCITVIDSHGRKEYKTSFLLLVNIVTVLLNIYIGGLFLWHFEEGLQDSNINSLKEAMWAVFMTMTTIGFGDKYPITVEGYITTGVCFLLGAVNLGTLIKTASNLVKDKNEVDNRQIYSIITELLRSNQHIEQELNLTQEVTQNSHGLDKVFEQNRYVSDNFADGWITRGEDSSGLLIISLEAYCKETGKSTKRWIPTDTLKDQKYTYNRFINNMNEL
ncbi:TMhelix containing protein [Vibrio phage 1.084.O._10N.261.49.F5]|nr:TMhelix containing protein [Vibrio phage 1.084.O._10N.261.49.F5]